MVSSVRGLQHSLCLSAVILPIATAAKVQDGRGNVDGRVADSSQAAVAGAEETLRNPGAGIEAVKQCDATFRALCRRWVPAPSTRFKEKDV